LCVELLVFFYPPCTGQAFHSVLPCFCPPCSGWCFLDGIELSELDEDVTFTSGILFCGLGNSQATLIRSTK
jgi:hypothetical protein